VGAAKWSRRARRQRGQSAINCSLRRSVDVWWTSSVRSVVQHANETGSYAASFAEPSGDLNRRPSPPSFPRQLVATHGNGFRVFLAFSGHAHCHPLPPVATARSHKRSILGSARGQEPVFARDASPLSGPAAWTMLRPDLFHVDLVQRLPDALERSVGIPRDALGVEDEDVAIALVVVDP
jgi:hypothetical protein